MKKQTLNEQVSRMREMMGCCKGDLREAVQPGSQEEMQLFQMVAQQVDEMGITQEDLDVPQDGEDLGKVKQKLANDAINPFLAKATAADLKEALKAIKRFKQRLKSMPKDEPQGKQPSADSNQTSTGPLNEGILDIFDEDFSTNELVRGLFEAFKIGLMMPYNMGALGGTEGILGQPIRLALGWSGYFTVLFAWAFILIFRCWLYDVLGNNETGNWANRLVQVLTLDITNIFTSDPYVRGCGLHKNY